MPLFAFIYSDECLECKDLLIKFRNYSDTDPNRTDIIFTAINCDVGDNCEMVQSQFFPSYAIISGENLRYWQLLLHKEQSDWESALLPFTSLQISEINNENKLFMQLNSTANGGSHVHVVISNISQLDPINDVGRKFVPMHVTFSYRINASATNPIVYIYRSPYCRIKFRGLYIKNEIEEFINEYKFSYAHEYDSNEWFIQNKYHRTAILFTNNLDYSIFDSLRVISKGFCESISTGFGFSYINQRSLKYLRVNFTELPLLIVSNKEDECAASFKKYDFRTIRSAIIGQRCDDRFRNIYKKALIHARISGNWFSIFIFGCALISIFFIRVYESYASKDE